ncbi:MAG: hypothetical protein Q8942_19750, partial [Bacillota bacterium]|nr:hypothetical protein [Bacillota bacterium]
YIDKLEGRVSEQLFLRINSEIDNQIKNITREQSSLKNQDSLIDEEYIKNILKSIDVRNLNNEIIRTIVDRIIVYDVGDKLDPIKIEKYISMEDIKNINDYGGVIISYKCCFPGKYIN